MTEAEFGLPGAIKDYIFDLHDAVRRSRHPEDVQKLYETKFKEISEKYFTQTSWPDAEAISNEADDDLVFLAFYRELAMRYYSTKAKQQATDYVESWSNYVTVCNNELYKSFTMSQLFDLLPTLNHDAICLVTSWIADIIQEFVYQFQGFCQFRTQAANYNAELLQTLESNKNIWKLSSVMSMLQKLVSAGTAGKKAQPGMVTSSSTFMVQFAYFASIEMGRLECLLGDFTASLQAVQHVQLHDRQELFNQLPLCYFNLYYHTAVSNMMLRRFGDALDLFGELILQVSRVLKASTSTSAPNRFTMTAQLQRGMDKALALAAIISSVYPAGRLDAQVVELMEVKWGEKIRKLHACDKGVFADLFESAAPKFVSAVVPNYTDIQHFVAQDASAMHMNTLWEELHGHLKYHRVLEYLTIYSNIDISKLTKLSAVDEAETISYLLALKDMLVQGKNVTGKPAGRANQSGLHFYIDNGVMIVESETAKVETGRTCDKYFAAGIRKNVELTAQLQKTGLLL